MFYYISGKISVKDPTFLVIEAGGVGYEVKISLGTYSKVRELENCRLYTYYHVREDVQALYGFLDVAEKNLFIHIISVSGIGPSTGLMMLSSLSREELQEAVVTGNVKLIQSVKGIGAKMAQRLVLELKDKLSKGETMGETSGSVPILDNKQRLITQAVEALVALGFPKAAAEKNANTVLKKYGDVKDLETLIKLSLKAGSV